MVMVRFPLANEVEILVPPVKVVVATQVGTPFEKPSTCPGVPAAVAPSVLVPVKYGS